MSDFLQVVPGTLPTRALHQYLLSAVGPRPIAFASTLSRDGIPNLAPFSFFNVFSAKPPVLIFSPARRVRDNTTKDTLTNIYEIPEVVVNVVSHSMVHQMNLASCEFPTGVNEFTKAGFTQLESDLVSPYRVQESPVQMECKVIEIKPLAQEGGAGQLIFAKVLKMHINREILDSNDMIDPNQIDLVGRMGKMWYSRAAGEALFEVNKPGIIPGMGIDALPKWIKNSTVFSGNNLGMLAMHPETPGDHDVNTFYLDEKEVMLSSIDSLKELHEAAKEVLDSTGDSDLAWKILLCKDRFRFEEVD